jgi:hypothetical protein
MNPQAGFVRHADYIVLDAVAVLKAAGYDAQAVCCDWQRLTPHAAIFVGCYDGMV